MKKLIIIAAMLLIITLSHAQSVSGIVGYSSNKSIIYGVEFKSDYFGGYIQRCYYNNNDLKKLPEDSYLINSVYETKYDGLMFGLNFHVKSISNITLSAGVGLLNEYQIYGTKAEYYKVSEKWACEISAGIDIIKSKFVVIAIRGGANTCINAFGTVTCGFKMDSLLRNKSH